MLSKPYPIVCEPNFFSKTQDILLGDGFPMNLITVSTEYVKENYGVKVLPQDFWDLGHSPFCSYILATVSVIRKL